jgi:hypothetical protein
MQEYPKYKYKKDSAPVVVSSSAEEKALGRGWHDTPASYGLETCPGSDADILEIVKELSSPAEVIEPSNLHADLSSTATSTTSESPVSNTEPSDVQTDSGASSPATESGEIK